MEADNIVKVFDAIVEILKCEGTEFLSCFPTNPIIDAAAAADLRPIVCRQERIGVGIADGYSRVNNGKRIGDLTPKNESSLGVRLANKKKGGNRGSGWHSNRS